MNYFNAVRYIFTFIPDYFESRLRELQVQYENLKNAIDNVDYASVAEERERVKKLIDKYKKVV